MSGIMREISSFNARSRKNNDDHDREDIISIDRNVRTTRFTANQILTKEKKMHRCYHKFNELALVVQFTTSFEN